MLKLSQIPIARRGNARRRRISCSALMPTLFRRTPGLEILKRLRGRLRRKRIRFRKIRRICRRLTRSILILRLIVAVITMPRITDLYPSVYPNDPFLITFWRPGRYFSVFSLSLLYGPFFFHSSRRLNNRPIELSSYSRMFRFDRRLSGPPPGPYSALCGCLFFIRMRNPTPVTRSSLKRQGGGNIRRFLALNKENLGKLPHARCGSSSLGGVSGKSDDYAYKLLMAEEFDPSRKSSMSKLDKALSSLNKTLKGYIPKNMPRKSQGEGKTDETQKTKAGTSAPSYSAPDEGNSQSREI